MINFIVCEDNKIILQKNIDIINKTMFNNDLDYRVYPFINYTSSFEQLIKEEMGKKIYILDIELEETSGIDIAMHIRDFDLESLIIISTTHIEYLPYTLKSKLMIFDFVSKFEDYEQNLENIIKKGLESFSSKYITFKSNGIENKVYIKDINYIKYDKELNVTVISTSNKIYETTNSFKIISSKLDNNFIKKDKYNYINKKCFSQKREENCV